MSGIGIRGSGRGTALAPGGNIFENIFMATTVHIPDELLAALDRRATELGTSRNRLIVRAVEQSRRDPAAWPPDLLTRLRTVTSEQAKAVDEMMTHIRKNRRSKPPVSF